jgi:hypothetical protein
VKRAVIFAVILLSALPARATFIRGLLERADTEALLDSEYFLDLRAFSWPRAWEDEWAASSGAYRISGASLDCCDLYLDQGLKLSRRLTPRLEFRFRMEQRDDKDRRETHHWLELETDIGRGWSVEVIGEPTYRKEDADIGLGARWRGGGFEARARRLAVDFNFNSRGSTSERYTLKPYTDQLSASLEAGDGRVWTTAELDGATRREIPAENRSFGYRRERVAAGWNGGGELAPRVAATYDREERLDRRATAAAGISTDFRRRAAALEATVRVRREKTEWEPGLAVLRRSTRADAPFAPAEGVTYLRWEIQPHLRWRRELSELVLLELSPFLSLGEDRARRTTQLLARRVVEAKTAAAVEFRFSPSAWIGLNANIDMDSPGKFWDGGNVRAMLRF